MKAGGGSIVNFSSVSYHTMTPLSVYQGQGGRHRHDARPRP
jgi:hypothetical protein